MPSKLSRHVFTLYKARTKFLVVTDSIRKDTLTQPCSNNRHDRYPRLLERLLRAVINLCPVTRRGVRWEEQTSSWEPNRPFSRSKNSHFQNEANSKTFLVKLWIWFAWEWNVIFIPRALHLASRWKKMACWAGRRSELNSRENCLKFGRVLLINND